MLDRESDRYLRFISDLRGQDPVSHGGDPAKAINVVRDWLDEQSGPATILPSGTLIHDRFKLCNDEMPAICAKFKLDAQNLSYKNHLQLIRLWLTANPV